MKRTVTSVLLLLLALLALAEDAPSGFAWKSFAELGITVQVPDGWHSQVVAANGTTALRITKTKVGPEGFETGLTVNLIRKDTDDAMAAATVGIGEYMEKLHDSFSKIIDSRITEREGVLTMILEGVRTLPKQEARGPYHTRTIVYIFKPTRRIYTVIFGTPVEQWETEFKLGQIMLNPIKFDAE